MPEFERVLSLAGWSVFVIAALLNLTLLYRSGRLVVFGFRRRPQGPGPDARAWTGLIGGVVIAAVFGVVAYFQVIAQQERRAEVMSYAGLSAEIDKQLARLGDGRVPYRVLIDIREDAAAACGSTPPGRGTEPRVRAACELVRDRQQ
jgi:hypothetical protein